MAKSTTLLLKGDPRGAVEATKEGIGGLKKYGGQADQTTSRMKRMGGMIGAASKLVIGFGVAAGAAAVGGLSVLTKQGLENVDALAKTSDRLGIATEKLAALQLAAEQTGSDADTLADGLKDLQIRIAEAGKGSSTAVEGFNDLNLSWEELAKMSPDEQFIAVSEAMQGVESQSKRTQLANDLLGEAGVRLLNTMRLGAEGLGDYEKKAETLGLTISRDTAAGVERFNDSMDLLGKSVKGIGNQLAGALAPVLVNITDGFYRWLESVGGVRGILDRLLPIIQEAIAMFITFFTVLKNVGTIIIEALVKAWQSAGDATRRFFDWFRGTLDTAITWLTNMKDRFVDSFTGWIQSVTSTLTGWWNWLVGLFSPLGDKLDDGKSKFLDMFTGWFNTAIDKLTSFFGWLDDALSAIGVDMDLKEKFTAGVEVVKGIPDKIADSAEAVVDKAVAAWNGTVDTVSGGLDKVATATVGLGTKVFDLGKKAVDGAKNLGGELANAHEESQAMVKEWFKGEEASAKSADNTDDIKDNLADAAGSAKEINEELTSKEILGAVRILAGAFSNTQLSQYADFADGITKMVEDAQSLWKVLSNLPQAIGNVWNSIKNGFQEIVNTTLEMVDDFASGRYVQGTIKAVQLALTAGSFKGFMDQLVRQFDPKRIVVGVSATGYTSERQTVDTRTAASGLVLSAANERGGRAGEEISRIMLEQFLMYDKALTDWLAALGHKIDLTGVNLATGRELISSVSDRAGRRGERYDIFGTNEFNQVDQSAIDNALLNFVRQWVKAIAPQIGQELANMLQEVADAATDPIEVINYLQELYTLPGDIESLETRKQLLEGSIAITEGLLAAEKERAKHLQHELDGFNRSQRALANFTKDLRSFADLGPTLTEQFHALLEESKELAGGAWFNELADSLEKTRAAAEALVTAWGEVGRAIEQQSEVAAKHVADTILTDNEIQRRLREIQTLEGKLNTLEATRQGLEDRRETLEGRLATLEATRDTTKALLEVEMEHAAALQMEYDAFNRANTSLATFTQGLHDFANEAPSVTQQFNALVSETEALARNRSFDQLADSMARTRQAAESLIGTWGAVGRSIADQSGRAIEHIEDWFLTDDQRLMKQKEQIQTNLDLIRSLDGDVSPELLATKARETLALITKVFDEETRKLEAGDVGFLSQDPEYARLIAEGGFNLRDHYIGLIEEINQLTQDKVGDSITEIVNKMEGAATFVKDEIQSSGEYLAGELKTSADRQAQLNTTLSTTVTALDATAAELDTVTASLAGVMEQISDVMTDLGIARTGGPNADDLYTRQQQALQSNLEFLRQGLGEGITPDALQSVASETLTLLQTLYDQEVARIRENASFQGLGFEAQNAVIQGIQQWYLDRIDEVSEITNTAVQGQIDDIVTKMQGAGTFVSTEIEGAGDHLAGKLNESAERQDQLNTTLSSLNDELKTTVTALNTANEKLNQAGGVFNTAANTQSDATDRFGEHVDRFGQGDTSGTPEPVIGAAETNA